MQQNAVEVFGTDRLNIESTLSTADRVLELLD